MPANVGEGCLTVPSRLKGIETHRFRLLFVGGVSHSLTVPSRLKGMETLYFQMRLCACKSLPVPSRLKGMETIHKFCAHDCVSSLPVPSRLKGIETLTMHVALVIFTSSDCAFPFEGNGNYPRGVVS